MKKQKILLPEEFRFSHEYCFFLHDVLTGILVQGEKAGIYRSVDIKAKNAEELNSLEGLRGNELIEWMKAHGYKDKAFELYEKRITAALLSDMCHFIYEALNCSKKAKLTVTYALLRKPFRDNLLCLERLLTEPEEFFVWFEKEKLDGLDMQKYPKEIKMKIIEKVFKEIKYPSALTPELIYGLRYDKEAVYGFDSLWNKATHLITTNKHIKTEDANFNFVFSDSDSYRSQWEHLYSMLPLLLFYTNQVVEKLVKRIIGYTKDNFDFTEMKMVIGLALWANQGPWKMNEDNLSKYVASMKEKLKFPCPFCKSAIIDCGQDIEKIFSLYKAKCPNCKKVIDVEKQLASINEVDY